MRQKLHYPLFLAALLAAGRLIGVPKLEPTARATPGGRGISHAVGGPDTARDNGHGSNATTPSNIPACGWWDIVKGVAQQVSANRLTTEAAGITFAALLSVLPALAALIPLSVHPGPKAVERQA